MITVLAISPKRTNGLVTMSNDKVIYGTTSDSCIINYSDVTVDIRPTAPCLLCKLIDQEFMGKPATGGTENAIESLSDDYHHTLGPGCCFRDPLYHEMDPFRIDVLTVDKGPMDLKEVADEAGVIL